MLISLVSFSQTFPESKSENHHLINGTNISLVPPTSFEASSDFKGFQNPADPSSMIMVVEIPGPYSEVAVGFESPELLKAQGMELKSKKEVKVFNFDGLLLEIDQAANGMLFSKHILLYGNEKSSTMINGAFLKESAELGMEIKESMLTTFIDSNLKADPRSALNYTLDESASSLKFKAVIGNAMTFNRDLKTPTQSEDQANLFSENSFAQIEIADQKLFCISRVQQYPDDYSIIPSKGIDEIEIDGLKGYELHAKNNDKETEEMYQAVLFKAEGGYYLFVGTYLADKSEKAIRDIKSLVRTFKRKK